MISMFEISRLDCTYLVCATSGISRSLVINSRTMLIRNTTFTCKEIKNNFYKTTELNDLRVIICLRKCKVSVERISVCIVSKQSAEHGIHCLPCSETNDVIYLLPAT